MAPAEYTVMSGAMPQVLHCILSHLRVVDVCRLSSVCREWHKVAVTKQLWKHLCHRDEINLQELVDHVPEGQRLCYKSLYTEYMILVKERWTTGQGVTTFSKTLQTPEGADFSGRCLAVSSDYIFAQQSHTIFVFSASTGEYSHQLTGLPAQHGDCSFVVSENGTKAAAFICETSFICVWNVQSGECMHTLQHPDNIDTMIMHAQRLAVTCFGASVFVWSMESGQLLHQLQGVHSADALVMDAHHIAVHDRHASVVRLWDVNTGTQVFTWIYFDKLDVILLDACTKSLVGIDGGGRNAAVTVWDTNTGMCTATTQSNPRKFVFGHLIHEGKFVIAYRNCSDHKRSIEIVDLGNCAHVLPSVNSSPVVAVVVNMAGPMCMRVLSNGLLIVAYIYSDCVDVWDMRKRLFIRRINVRGQGRIECVHASFNQLHVVLQNNSKHTYKKFYFAP